MTGLRTAKGFDWGRVVWGKPDEPQSKLCSYCFAGLESKSNDWGESTNVPLMLCADSGHVAQFCDPCVEKWFGLKAAPSARIKRSGDA